MTPTLVGRIQTRLLLLATVGAVWTALIVPFLPGGAYVVAFSALLLTAVLGVVIWEPLYHLLQQFRWEKDWPAMFGFVSGLPEGVLVLALLRYGLAELAGAPGVAPAVATFWVHFWTTWTLVWFAAHGPLRVVSLRWRYRGGRLW